MSARCRVCSSPTTFIFSGDLLKKSDVKYYECPECGYVQTEEPYWLEEAYKSPINVLDTGIMTRNLDNVNRVIASLWALNMLDGRVVDFAGGYGILVRLLRDAGINAYWLDKYSGNLLARGFEDDGSSAQLITSFEAFEHFVDPISELKSMLERAPAVLISTTLIPTPTPHLRDWWYYGSNHGQHIGFFRETTLKRMAKMLGKQVVSDGHSYHLISDINISKWKWRKVLKRGELIRKLLSKQLRSKTDDDYQKINRSF